MTQSRCFAKLSEFSLKLGILLVAFLQLHFASPKTLAQSSSPEQKHGKMLSLDRSGTQWAPHIEWAIYNPTYSDNPFDLAATVTFVHAQSGHTHITGMFFVGDSTWKFRFTGTETGLWTFTSSSVDPDLDRLKGTVSIYPNPDPDIHGFLIAYGTKFGRQTGQDGALKGEIPKVYMNMNRHQVDDDPFLMSLMSQPKVRSDYIGETIANGHNALFIQMNNQWLAWDSIGYEDHSSENPDPASFRVLESLIVEAHAAGLHTVIWAWGDEERQWTPVGVGGINGIPDRRLQRYIAARLGPLPGWSLGYGFDLWEWTTEGEMREWAKYMHDHLGWPHLLWARERSNSELDVVSNDIRPDGVPLDEFYRVALAAIDSSNGRPVFFERRFTSLRDQVFTMENTRQSMWQLAMAGGAGGWWGFFEGTPFPYSNPEQLVTHEDFWKDRFRLDFQPDTSISDGMALTAPAKTHYIFYKEDSDTLQMDLTAMAGAQQAYAVDTKSRYQQLNLKNFAVDSVTWIAPYLSDWAIAVGHFSGSSGTDITPPTISAVQTFDVINVAAKIRWTTDELADSQVEYGFNSSYGNITMLDSERVTNHRQVLRDLQPSTQYHYRVRSRDAAGNLNMSGDFSFTTPTFPPPNAPSNLITTARSSSVLSLTWTDNASDEAGFIIERALDSNAFLVIDSVRADVEGFVDSGLQAGTRYRYRVRAYNSNGNSAYSTEASATTYKVFTLNVSTLGSGTVVLDPAGGVYDSSTVVSLRAEAAAGWQFSGWSGAITGNTNPATVTMTGDVSVTASFADVTPPVLSDVTASGITGIYATISWVTDELADTQVEYGVDITYGSNTALDSALVTSHSQVLRNLQLSTQYHYRVLSRDGAGNLATSGDFTFTTSAFPPPNAPSELVATASSSSALELSWADNASDEAGFLIERASGAGAFGIVDSVAADVTSYEDSGLQAGTRYRYRLRAYNRNGNSVYSAEASATTYKVFTLNVSTLGSGTVVLDPAGGVYDSSTVVSLTAEAAAGWQFNGWSGGISGNTNPAKVSLDSTVSVTASFGRESRVSDGLLALYRLDEGAGSMIRDVSGVGVPLNLSIPDPGKVVWLADGGLFFANDSALAKSNGAADKLFAGLTATQALTVEAWIEPENLVQSGPARMVSYSQSNSLRNFTLGQAGDGVVMRIRTPQSGLNGADPDLRVQGILDTTLQHLVATYDGATARLYLDGVQQADTLSLFGNFSNWDASYELVLGNEAIASRPWRGSLHLVAIYGRALSDAEVLQNFNARMTVKSSSNAVHRAAKKPDRQEMRRIDDYYLYENYPNPFNPSTMINYQLPEISEVKLAIYNLRGQLVRTLVSGEMPAGSYRVVWDGVNDAGVRVASGVYLYAIRANAFVQQRKLIFMK